MGGVEWMSSEIFSKNDYEKEGDGVVVVVLCVSRPKKKSFPLTRQKFAHSLFSGSKESDVISISKSLRGLVYFLDLYHH